MIPLTFTANTAGSTVKLIQKGSLSLSEMYYRRASNDSWIAYTIGDTITLDNIGDMVQFWHNVTRLSFSSADYAQFVMTGSIAGSGNVMSLVNYRSDVPYRGFTHLFQVCSSLTAAPELPSLTPGESAYMCMFYGCNSLVYPPDLPAPKVTGSSYREMFYGCTSLIRTPKINITSVTGSGNYIFYQMFYGCSSLTEAYLALPVTKLTGSQACDSMFENCSSLRRIQLNCIEWPSNTANWVKGVAASGTFIKSRRLVEIRGTSNIPFEWQVQNFDAYISRYTIPSLLHPLGISVREDLPLTLTAQQANSTVTLNATGSPTVSGLHYRLGKSGPWLPYTIGTTITLAAVGDSVQFWNSASTLSSSSSNFVQFALTGLIRADGSIQSMLAWTDSVPAYSFYMLFYQCSSLTQAPNLPAASVSSYGYQAMFNGCSRLTVSPVLPAVDVRNMCYSSMFRNCSSLVTASPIFAGRLGEYSFVSMFSNCQALVNPPELHITNLAPYCCNEMFGGCSSLADIPNLPDITLFSYCYYNMFRNCTSLTEAVLPSTALNTGSYRMMFRGCSSLASIEVAFGSWNSNVATEMWVEGVAASGTFIKPAALAEEYGVDRIPEGWTVVNK